MKLTLSKYTGHSLSIIVIVIHSHSIQSVNKCNIEISYNYRMVHKDFHYNNRATIVTGGVLLQARIAELEEELEAERAGRTKVSYSLFSNVAIICRNDRGGTNTELPL